MHRVTSICALVAIAATSSPVAAKCAMSHLRPKVLTTSSIDGGGIVVATEQVPYGVEDKGDVVQPTWLLAMAGSTVAPKIDVIAPGLAVYRLRAGSGGAKLLDANKKVIATVTIDKDTPTPLTAPKLKGIRHDKTLGRGSSAITTATLDAAPPVGAVALVLADAKGKPRSFGMIADPAAKEIEVYAHDYCGVVPNETVESKAGDKVTLFWVDASGRVSPASKPITITGKPPKVID